MSRRSAMGHVRNRSLTGEASAVGTLLAGLADASQFAIAETPVTMRPSSR